MASAHAAARRDVVCKLVEDSSDLSCIASISVPGADVFLLGPLVDDGAVALQQLRSSLEAVFSVPRQVEVTRAALSRVCHHPEDYAATNGDLAEALGLLDALGRRKAVILHTDLGMLRLLTDEGRRGQALRFANELLRPLIEHDDEACGDLLTTLRAYLASGGHIRATASNLGVHENTVRYRLGKIRRISGVDADQLDHLLDARFALHVLDLATGGVVRDDVAGDACAAPDGLRRDQRSPAHISS